MKICDVTQFYSEVGGGVKRYLHEKRRWVVAQDRDEHILVVPGAENKVVREGRLTLCTVRSPKVNQTSRYRVLLNLRQAEEMILHEKPDIIESGDPYHVGWSAFRVGDELEVPVVGFYHSHFPEAYLRTVLKYGGSWMRDVVLAYAEDYIRNLYNRFDRSLVPSQFLVDVLEDWGVTNAVRVRLGVDLHIFKQGSAHPSTRERLGVRPDQLLLLYVGRLSGEKNTRILLEAWERVAREKGDQVAFLIVGEGSLRHLVEDSQKRIAHLKWIPFCDDSHQLAEYYRAADLFVHPGICETFGLVTMESQACGCPVVGIRGSYMDANVFAGLDLWAEANSGEALATAIDRFLRSDLKGLGATAAETVKSRFGWDMVFGHIREIYQSAIDAKKSRIRLGGQVSE
jgi:alpha-1,6-mannosyltransferase